ncbi:MAG: hypothetical protein Q4P65_00845 [Eubacteriales bacterium]|nr:hypothetical protein [Eubacteriales bacterium]
MDRYNTQDPRERKYTGRYAGRYTGQLTGQLPDLSNEEVFDENYNPLDYYKGEGPSPAERRPARPQRRRSDPRQRRPVNRQSGAHRNYGAPRQQRSNTEFQLIFRRVLIDFVETFKNLFSARPESAYRVEISWPSRFIFLFVNILIYAAYNTVQLAAAQKVFKNSILSDGVTDILNFGHILPSLRSDSMKGGYFFLNAFLIHMLTLVILFLALYLVFNFISREQRSLDLAGNNLAIATVPHSVTLIALMLLGLAYKPLHGYLSLLPALVLYLNVYIGLREVNRDDGKLAYWLGILFVLLALFMKALLPAIIHF